MTVHYTLYIMASASEDPAEMRGPILQMDHFVCVDKMAVDN